MFSQNTKIVALVPVVSSFRECVAYGNSDRIHVKHVPKGGLEPPPGVSLVNEASQIPYTGQAPERGKLDFESGLS